METYYKFYKPDDTKHALEERSLQFSSVSSFNDFNEASFDLSGEVARQCTDPLRSIYDSRHEVSPGYPPNDLSREDFYKFLESKGLGAKFVEYQAKQLAIAVAQNQFSLVGALCLCRNFTNNLMWSHYAANGTGFCIGIKASAKVLMQSEVAGLSGVKEVHYRRRRSNLQNCDTLPERLEEIVFVKSRDWAYEEEVRCLRRIERGHRAAYAIYEIEDLACIAMGPRAGRELVEKCALLRNEFFPGVPILHTAPNPKAFVLDVYPEMAPSNLFGTAVEELVEPYSWIPPDYKAFPAN